MEVAIETGNKEYAALVLAAAHECTDLDTTELDNAAYAAFDLEY